MGAGLDIGDMQSVLRRYRAACPDSVGERGCDMFQNLCNGMGALEELGSGVDRQIAEIEDFLDNIENGTPPRWHGPSSSDPITVFGGPEVHRRPIRENNPEPFRKDYPMPDIQLPDAIFTPNDSEPRVPDEATRKWLDSWESAKKALPEIDDAIRELDRLLALEVRTADTLKKAREKLAQLQKLQDSPRLDHSKAKSRIAYAQSVMDWCNETRLAIAEDMKPLNKIARFNWDGLVQDLNMAKSEWLKSHSRNSAVADIEKKAAEYDSRFKANAAAARASLAELERADDELASVYSRMLERIEQIESDSGEDDELGSRISSLGGEITRLLSGLEKELKADSDKQPSISRAVRRGCNWDIAVGNEDETSHLRVVRRMEAVSKCRKIARAIKTLQPSLEELTAEHLNETSGFPPFVAFGETTYVHSRPGVEVSMPNALAFPFDRPILMPGSVIGPLMLRLTWSCPVGKLSFVALDQETLGQNMMPVNGFADVPGLLKVVTSVDSIQSELVALQSEIAAITNGALKGDVRNWAEYNAAHPRSPLPCKILVVHSFAGFERGFGLAETVANVLRNGPRCGVFALVSQEAYKKLDKREAEKLRAVEFQTLATSGRDLGKNLRRLKAEALLPELPSNVPQLAGELAAVVKKALERPAKGFGELFANEAFWSGDASKGFDALIGWDERDEPVRFCLGDRIPHALLGGATGSGKSNLIHVLVHALCHRYSSEELNLFLLDYKDGLEFQKYTSSDVSWLPQAKTISTVNDPGYALTLFAYLKEEQKRRKKQFGGLSSYVEYRASGGKMPRIVVMIDEFHKMFEGTTVDAVCDGLNDIFKQGRAYGIHLVLATQTLNGLQFPGKKGMLDQIGLRFALHSNTGEDDILQPGNTAAKEINIPQCILNESGGNKGANKVFKLPYADHKSDVGLAFRKRCEEGAARNRLPLDCRVFNGMRLPPLPSVSAVSQIIAKAPPSYDSHLLLGVRNEFLARPFFASFDDEPGGHLLICGENGDLDENGNVTGLDVWNGLRRAVWQSLAAQRGCAFVHYDPLAREKPMTLPANGVFLGAEVKDDGALLAAFEKLLQSDASQKYIIVENFGRARLLHPEAAPMPTFGRPRDTEPPKPTARSLFLEGFASGAESPFHVVLFIHNYENTRRAVLERSRDANILAGCAKRIAFNLAKADMENFMPRSRRMDTKGRVLFCDETQPDDPVSILAYSGE